MTEPAKDYYKILEITREATSEDIRAAYKNLAKKWHPDKNPHNREESEQKFKEISEANSILSDPNKKMQYDQFGICDGDNGGMQGGGPDISNLFNQMGGMWPNMFNQQRQQRQQPTQEVRVNLTLNEIYSGNTKLIEIPTNAKCSSCEGHGTTDKKKNICPSCNGQKVKVAVVQLGPGMFQQRTMPCPQCKQTGSIIDKSKECTPCKGNGTIPKITTKTIIIQPNFDYMTKMKLNNYGNYDLESDKNADVYIIFTISDLDKYNLSVFNKYDLIHTVKISLWDAFSGYTMYYTHPDNNKYSFKFNDIIKNEDARYILNLGLPYSEDGTQGYGKLYLKFNHIYPETILTGSSLEKWFKNKNNTDVVNKSEYKPEKVRNVNDEQQQHAQQQATQCPVQ
ncbi:MAG: hypothetical protein Gaeavirus2_7 [Gaeavirus sp.]|uniref:DnaJ domain protein n=1 Tax=Gaeavirus sp. TaxID=2487767 RepID=A0A3G4ZYD4_9VIRU|nr:MAG: hypothetical protein Gaeavirus2_7 [Gaeavirus sp.]